MIALNAAFPPGTEAFLLTYGGDRRYDSETNTLMFNGTKYQVVSRKAMTRTFDPALSLDQKFDVEVKFSDAIRQQMYRFYEAFYAGKISQQQVRRFNEAYVMAGGCALSATAPKSNLRADRYLYSMNLMANAMNKLGFSVQR